MTKRLKKFDTKKKYCEKTGKKPETQLKTEGLRGHVQST